MDRDVFSGVLKLIYKYVENSTIQFVVSQYTSIYMYIRVYVHRYIYPYI